MSANSPEFPAPEEAREALAKWLAREMELSHSEQFRRSLDLADSLDYKVDGSGDGPNPQPGRKTSLW
jgi:hypothetical protein